jgi:hypothetical protein
MNRRAFVNVVMIPVDQLEEISNKTYQLNKSYTECGFARGPALNESASPFHGIHILIVHPAVSSIPDPELIMLIYRTDIT